MRLIVTIDTEEDNWDDYGADRPAVSNVDRIEALQELLDSFGVRPTYLVTYPVARSPAASGILRRILDRGGCEIGAHCHPWSTPPFEERRTERNSMLCNLEPTLQARKIETLTRVIEDSFSRRPTSFRAGRWAYSRGVAAAVASAGYVVDTSVAPYVDWSEMHGPDFSDVALRSWFRPGELFGGPADSEPIEIPATVGFLQKNFEVARRLHRRLTRGPIRRLRLYGVLYRMRLLNRVWLSPEFQSSREMIALTRVAARNGMRHVNLVFHSSTLQAGLTPFVRTKDDERVFWQRIREYSSFARREGLSPILLTDAASARLDSGAPVEP